MKTILALLLVFLLAGSVAWAGQLKCGPCDDAQNTIQKNSTEIVKLVKEGGQSQLESAFSLVGDEKEKITILSPMTKKMVQFEGPEEKYNRLMASNVIELYAPIVAADMISVADALVSTKTKENVDKAKSLYRDIVITFTGPVYKSYIKKAEFALEDIKGMTFQEPKTKKKKS